MVEILLLIKMIKNVEILPDKLKIFFSNKEEIFLNINLDILLKNNIFNTKTITINNKIIEKILKKPETNLEKIIDKIISENPKNVELYKSGKDKLFGFFVGQVMKSSGGKANPQLVNEILKKKLN